MNDESIKTLLKKFNIAEKDIAIYYTAFTHRSALNELKSIRESNERLEFLGDSILSYIVSSFLFKKRPEDSEGNLTHLRAYIVKTDSLARVSKSLDLGTLLQLSRGEELSAGRENPQILANTYEALLGAIFLDQGIEMAQNFVHETLLPLFALELEEGAPRDSKSRIQELTQSKFQVSPKYRILSTSGPDHAKRFKVGIFVGDQQLGVGEGFSKQQAEEEAAQQALLGLTNQTL